MDRLKPLLRTDHDVYVAGQSGLLYGPKTSILNRLIVSQLERLQAFHFLAGKTRKIEYNEKGQYVVHSIGAEPRRFDEVIERHGPPKGGALAAFPHIFKKCTGLQERWKLLGMFDDPTRVAQWRQGDYGETGSASDTKAVVSAHGLHIWKDVRDDGSCSLYYVIDGVSVNQGELRGVRFSYESVAGSVGEPVLDKAAKGLGMKWLPDAPPPGIGSTINEVRDRIRRVSGVFVFKRRLKRDQPPVRFGFTVSVLNGHARSSLEVRQLYERGNHGDIAGRELPSAEAFSRAVWFPIRSLSVTLSLPPNNMATPRPRVYRSRAHFNTTEHQVLLLEQDPPKWEELEHSQVGNLVSVEPRATNSWVLFVQDPKVGHSYGLEWNLPTAVFSPEVARNAAIVRSRLLLHGRQRRNDGNGVEAIHAAFISLANKLYQRYGMGAGERLGITLMTYSERARELVMVDAVENGKARRPSEFTLPYGLGIAGACLKEGNMRLYIKNPIADGSPTVYLPRLDKGRNQAILYKMLLSWPVLIPGFENLEPALKVPVARPHYCVGVVSIGSDLADTKLLQIADPKTRLKEQQWMRKHFDAMAEVFLKIAD